MTVLVPMLGKMVMMTMSASFPATSAYQLWCTATVTTFTVNLVLFSLDFAPFPPTSRCYPRNLKADYVASNPKRAALGSIVALRRTGA